MGMGRNIASLIVVGLVAVPVTDTEAAGAGPNPNEVYVQSITYGGSGSPQGTVGTSFSDDRQSLTLSFDKFIASLGPGVPITENRKNSQLNLNIHVPQGWTYAIATVDIRGNVSLSAGVTGQHKGTSYFQGEVQQTSFVANFTGPVAKDYLVRDTISLASQTWMPCGHTVPLNLNLQVRLFNQGGSPSAQGQLTTDSIDGKVKVVLGLQWRRC